RAKVKVKINYNLARTAIGLEPATAAAKPGKAK
ncbi:MAG: hypothetical protein JWQ46_1445, partial [Phenylobacterium sp.]|nr:hypothetical protein [Phenylobacterium sp.]